MKVEYKKLVRRRILEGVLVVILSGVLVSVLILARVERKNLVVAQVELDKLPEKQSLQVTLNIELEKRGRDIDRIREFTVAREQVGEVVNALTGMAIGHGVELRVAQVSEAVEMDEIGREVVQSGPLRKVRLKTVGFGRPDDLIKVLYESEHMPYLISVYRWKVFDRGPGISLGRSAPAPGSPVVEVVSEDELGQDPWQLEMELTLSIAYEEN